MKTMPKLNNSGTALIFAYCSIALLIVLVGSITFRATSELNLAQRNMALVEALYLSEGGAESVAYNLGYAVANYLSEPVTSTPLSISTLAFPPSSGFLPSNTAVSYTCEPIDDEVTITDSSGVVTLVRNYKITAITQNTDFQTLGTPMTVPVSQIMARRKTYTFQHAVFYADDLEILPGPTMTLSGRIHSNSDIYLGANNLLTVDADYLYSADEIYNYRKNNGAYMPGDVSIKLKDQSSYALMKESGELVPLDCDRSDWATESQIRWNGTVKSSVHGVTALAVPSVASIQPGGFYATQADVEVENETIKKNGFVLTDGVDVPPGTITTTTSMYNNRESKWIKMVEIDMHKLAGYDEGDPPGSPSFPNNLPSNGLLYATRDDATSGQQPGVRLNNGSEVHSSAGLTVVSNVPVYVKGDYNNLNKKPASVICDAVNILSNNWDDATGYGTAADTQVNAAFIAGADTTTPGNYNGGLENYPRLHENWSGSPKKVLSIRGSFVELWNSMIAQGQWVYGSPFYKAPVRDWDYDSDFNDESNLPPFTPFAVEIARVAWWRG